MRSYSAVGRNFVGKKRIHAVTARSHPRMHARISQRVDYLNTNPLSAWFLSHWIIYIQDLARFYHENKLHFITRTLSKLSRQNNKNNDKKVVQYDYRCVLSFWWRRDENLIEINAVIYNSFHCVKSRPFLTLYTPWLQIWNFVAKKGTRNWRTIIKKIEPKKNISDVGVIHLIKNFRRSEWKEQS